MIERDQAAGGIYCAHVLRAGSTRLSPFTSLRRTPHRPDLEPPRRVTNACHKPLQAEGIGWPAERSKGGETGISRLGGHERSRLPGGLGPLGLNLQLDSRPAQWSH